ncbi:uncharacterized protein [Parasteatoda tepidariorum]|uniref:uncharacterized protein isoform X1 n=1 Tax=Parasteatoda tepidariorum TaxID=114398 RepID=UPI00077F98E4
MCDRCCWSKHFYKQYLEQHSTMMQWIHQGHQHQHEGYLQTLNPVITPCIHQGIQPYEGCLPSPAVPHDFYSFMNKEKNQVPFQKKRTRQISSNSSVSSSEKMSENRKGRKYPSALEEYMKLEEKIKGYYKAIDKAIQLYFKDSVEEYERSTRKHEDDNQIS